MAQLIQYDESNPPVANMCCQEPDIHAPGCNGNCEKKVMTELDVTLHNEIEFCRRQGIQLQGILPFMIGSVPGLPVDILEMNFKLTALIKFLIESDVIDVDRLSEIWATDKIDTFSLARKQMSTQQRIVKPPIIGPDGNSRLN